MSTGHSTDAKLPEGISDGEESKVKQQNTSPSFYSWPNPHHAHLITPAKKNLTTNSILKSGRICELCPNFLIRADLDCSKTSPFTSILCHWCSEEGKGETVKSHPPPLQGSCWLSKQGSPGKWKVPGGLVTACRQALGPRWDFWGPDQGGTACLHCILDQTAREIVTPFIFHCCLKNKFDYLHKEEISFLILCSALSFYFYFLSFLSIFPLFSFRPFLLFVLSCSLLPSSSLFSFQLPFVGESLTKW